MLCYHLSQTNLINLAFKGVEKPEADQGHVSRNDKIVPSKWKIVGLKENIDNHLNGKFAKLDLTEKSK